MWIQAEVDKQIQEEGDEEAEEPPVLPGTSGESKNKNRTVCRHGGDPGVDAPQGQTEGQQRKQQGRKGKAKRIANGRMKGLTYKQAAEAYSSLYFSNYRGE
eukprot:7084178-Karenia_brevis.AAC.1